MSKQNPISALLNPFMNSPYIDKWTAIHLAAGAFIVKLALWLGASSVSAVLWVLMIGLAWEVMEYYTEGVRPYGGVDSWLKNTISDLVVETGIAIWIVLPA